jgi:hypothetical protein
VAVVLGVPGGPIVNTGDVRVHDGLFQSSVLKRLASGVYGTIQHLFLDTTWAHPDLLHLPQHDAAVDAAVDVIEARSASDTIVLHSFFGDEELLRGIAAATAHRGRLLFASESRFSEVNICDLDLSRSCERLASNCARGRVVVVERRGWRSDKRLQHLDCIELSCSTLRWATHVPHRMSERTRPILSGGIWRVLFAMHSSLSELRELVGFLRPRRVEPLVPFICQSSWGGSASTSALFDDLLCPADSPESQIPAECFVGATPSSSTATGPAPAPDAGATSSSSTATGPAPAPDTLALLHDSQWDMLADHVGIPGLARSLKRRRTATTELDSVSGCSDTLPNDFDETPLLG